MVAIARRKEFADKPLSDFASDVLAGLSRTPKTLPPKYFYDAEGSRLFEKITVAPEYYPTRCEMQALQQHAGDIARLIPSGAALVEFGTGSTRKARILLGAAKDIAAYVPVDISAEMLASEAAALRRDRPTLRVLPVAADFTAPFELPEAAQRAQVRVGFFPGSTIGNFEPHEAARLLTHFGRVLGAGALMVIGIDLIKDNAILNAAYNDAQGVTAQFNLNLLKRMNRELGANFRLDLFEHHAFFNRERSRVEMHLASLTRQQVKVAGTVFSFRAGETIHTENSYKYSLDSFRALARGAGWTPLQAWTDADERFSIHALSLSSDARSA